MNTIDFAISMEKEGQKYYLEQMELNKENELHTVFKILADSEMEHAKILKKYKAKEIFDLSDNFVKPEVKVVFRNLKNLHKEHRTKQLDVYRMATVQEEKSIELYQEMRLKAIGPLEQELFEYLIREEKNHLKLFEELVVMLTRPEEWVESAEFGVREEY